MLNLTFSGNANLEVSFPGRNLSFSNWTANGSSYFQHTSGFNNSNVTLQDDASGSYPSSLFNFTMEVGTVANHVYFRSYGFASDQHYSHSYCVAYSRSSTGLSSIRITPDSGRVFISGTEVILYKYKSS